MAIAAMPRGGADARPVPIPHPTGSAAPPTGPDARFASSDTPATGSGAVPTTARARLIGSLTRSQQITAGVIVAAALLLAAVGLYLSFEHVATFAHERLRFRTLDKARLFTVGVDVGILVLIALDLLMAWLRRPIGWVRYPVWLLTGVTVVLNAASAAPLTGPWTGMDYIAGFAHGVVPVLFIVVVEVGKTSVDRIVRPAADQAAARVPLHRWFLAPFPTFALWRRMRLWAVPTYAEAVRRDQDLRVYRVMLERRYGRGWRRKAPADVRLPLTMAPYGLTIDEALALPRQAEEREAALREAKEAAQAAAEARAADRAAQAQIARLRTAGKVQAAQHEVEASTQQAAITARAELVATERAAEVEAKALAAAAAAEAEARRAAAVKKAADDRAAAAEQERHAAELEADAAEQRQRAAVVQEREAAAALRRAQAEEAAKTALENTAAAEARAAEHRLRAAELERRAVELEDEARLSQRERAVRKLARLVLEHAGDVEALPLETVTDLFSVSKSTASDYRREAAELIRTGYRPEGI
ncbi:DUF2637 domain-containing protein [Streptomyces lavendulocolor]|uniref:DUF2637 domain-containing protein n=1 Tax=Streptomyces lavendulocolor TaxID=67316 RepID=UPI003C2F0F12